MEVLLIWFYLISINRTDNCKLLLISYCEIDLQFTEDCNEEFIICICVICHPWLCLQYCSSFVLMWLRLSAIWFPSPYQDIKCISCTKFLFVCERSNIIMVQRYAFLFIAFCQLLTNGTLSVSGGLYELKVKLWHWNFILSWAQIFLEIC